MPIDWNHLSKATLLSAIDRSLDLHFSPLVFKTSQVRTLKDGCLLLTLENSTNASSHHRFDQTLEEGSCAWGEDFVNKGKVIVVHPEAMEITIELGPASSHSPPAPGAILTLLPYNFLLNIKELLSDPESANDFEHRLQTFEPITENRWLDLDPSPELRSAQRDAFKLTDFNRSQLWGPPGTGKTFSLGAIVASVLKKAPSTRILLSSATNRAVDLLLINSIKAATKLKVSPENFFRLGGSPEISEYDSHFGEGDSRTSQVLGVSATTLREYRLAKIQESRAVTTVEKHEAKRSLRSCRASMYAENRAKYLDRGKSAKVLALTLHRLIGAYTDLKRSPASLLVLDEGSQVPVSAAVVASGIAERMLIGGDPKQLSPISLSDDFYSKQWFGQSVLETFPDEEERFRVFLDEQSRMHPLVCDPVSKTYYGGRLKVAEREALSTEWRRERDRGSIDLQGGAKIECGLNAIDAMEPGEWNRSYRGFVRLKSAELICDAVELLHEKLSISYEEILVLTPFHAQNRMIREKLLARSVTDVAVSTVHAAQGGENLVVLFDPVIGRGNLLLQDSDHEFHGEGSRLLNVATSRAKGYLLLFCSKEDLAENRVLKRFLYTAFDPKPVRFKQLVIEEPERQESTTPPRPRVIRRAGRN